MKPIAVAVSVLALAGFGVFALAAVSLAGSLGSEQGTRTEWAEPAKALVGPVPMQCFMGHLGRECYPTKSTRAELLR